MKDFGLHNAVALLLLVGASVASVGVGIISYQIGDTWTPANTNFLSAALSLSCFSFIFLIGLGLSGSLMLIARGYSNRGNDRELIPPGFQIVDAGDQSVPQYPTGLPMLMDVPEKQAGSWNRAVQIEDEWS